MSRGLVLETTNGPFRFTIEEDEVIHLDTTGRRTNVKTIVLLLESWMCLLADSPLNDGRRSRKPNRVFADFRRDFKRGPLKDFVLSYSTLAHQIVSSTTVCGSGTLTGDWIPGMKDTPVFKEYLHWYKTGDLPCLRYVYTFLNFGKKLSYTDPDLDTTALRGWEKVEERLHELKLDATHLAGMAKVLAGLVPNFSKTPLSPKFGPGRVAEGGVFGSIAKANNLKFDSKIDRLFFRGHYANYGLSEEMGFHPDKVLPDPLGWTNASGVSGRTSRVKFVPKDIKTSRTICMEPNVYMFAQQAVLERLLKAINSGPARRFINIQDQSRNADLAWWGSLTTEIDTIDLSSASDSVSTDLVRGIFPRELLYNLLATRTTKVLTPDGRERTVKKFAPMGSALCFPVQCLIFTTVVVYAAIQLKHGLQPGEGVPVDSFWLEDIERTVESLFQRDLPCKIGSLSGSRTVEGYSSRRSGKFEPAAVYGDDICVDSHLTPYVTTMLSLLGFEVNHSKSFTGGQAFRESCGGFFWNGEDVTPLYFRVKQFSGNVIPAESVASMISCCNLAGDRGYRNLRRCLLQRLLYADLGNIPKFNGINSFLFTCNRSLSYGIYSRSPRNTHLRRRYSPDIPGKPFFQRDEYCCLMLDSDERIRRRGFEIHAHERYLHLRWWGGRSGDVNADFGLAASRTDTSGSRLRRVWVPAES